MLLLILFYLPSWSFIPTCGSLEGTPSPNQVTSLKHSCPLFSALFSLCMLPKKLTAWIQTCKRAKRWHCHPLQQPLSHLAFSLLILFNVWSIELLCLCLDLTWSRGRPIVARWILESCLYWPVWGHLFTRWAPFAYSAGRRTRGCLWCWMLTSGNINWCLLFTSSLGSHKSPLGACLGVRDQRSLDQVLV